MRGQVSSVTHTTTGPAPPPSYAAARAGRLGAVTEQSTAQPTQHPVLEDFPAHSHDKLRYGDTDRQGHVNNAVFSTLLETGRVELLHPGGGASMNDEGASWVIVRIELDLVGEITWPGSIDIGTRVEKVGRSSVTMQQGLFQAGRPVARATTVIVQMDDETRGSRALGEQLAQRFRALQG